MRADPTRLRDALVDRYGVGLRVEEKDGAEGQRISFEPSDVPASHSFLFGLTLGWRSVELSVSAGAYSRGLVAAMGQASSCQRDTFRAFLRTVAGMGGSVTLRINDAPANWQDCSIWSGGWKSLSLEVSRRPFAPADESEVGVFEAVLPWAALTLGAVLCIVPLEAADENARREGAIQEILATRYERDPINRSLCLEIHGMACKACGFDFGAAYGEAGAGYIEVHHVKPLAEGGGEEVVINTLTDLVPLCANCHAMAHRRTPPYSVSELRAMLGCEPKAPMAEES